MMIAMAKHCLTPFAELAIIGQQRVKNIAVNQRRVRFSLLLFRADGELPSTVCDLKLSRTDPPRLFPLRVRHQREATGRRWMQLVRECPEVPGAHRADNFDHLRKPPVSWNRTIPSARAFCVWAPIECQHEFHGFFVLHF
jgi:hypothetical protein